MLSRTRLLLADDHLETADLLRDLLQPEFEVIAHVTDGFALVRYAERLSPDVIVSDISMPDLDGIAAATAILRATRRRASFSSAFTAIPSWCRAALPPARWATC